MLSALSCTPWQDVSDHRMEHAWGCELEGPEFSLFYTILCSGSVTAAHCMTLHVPLHVFLTFSVRGHHPSLAISFFVHLPENTGFLLM